MEHGSYSTWSIYHPPPTPFHSVNPLSSSAVHLLQNAYQERYCNCARCPICSSSGHSAYLSSLFWYGRPGCSAYTATVVIWSLGGIDSVFVGHIEKNTLHYTSSGRPRELLFKPFVATLSSTTFPCWPLSCALPVKRPRLASSHRE